MPRVKEFDEAEVLDQALELFRSRGFNQTSFADLTSELGVSRQSLYDTYGNKETLYHTALARYRDRTLDAVRRKLEDPAPVRQVFQSLFDRIIDGQCENGAHGCLMVNTMIEVSRQDPDAKALALEHAREMERIFSARISLAQRQGEIGRDKDPAALARYFYHSMLGLAVAARAFAEKDSLKETVRLSLSAFG